MATRLSDLLDREFRLLCDRQGLETSGFESVERKADHLGLSQSHLSRIRSGKSGLTKKMAEQIANRLRSDDPTEAERLAVQLLEATGILGTGGVHTAGERRWQLEAVEDLFQRLSRPQSLLCIEYRDFPRADSRGKYNQYAVNAGQAIAGGMCMAMFQPFGRRFEKSEKKEYHGFWVREYCERLLRKCRDVYERMKEAAIQHGRELKLGEAELKQIEQRIVLYERDGAPFLWSGIQTRLFFAQIPCDNHTNREVWEWVAAQGEDLFVRREPDSVPTEAIADQFFPVTQFWEATGRLPVSTHELRNAVKDYQGHIEAKMRSPQWTVYREPTAGAHRNQKS